MNNPKLRLKGFQNDWLPTKISELADIVGGGTPSTMIDSYWNGNIPWFTPSEVGKKRYVTKSDRTITRDGLNNSSAKLIPAYSILLSSRATVGEASINTCECSTNQGFQSLVPLNVNLDFLYTLVSTIKKDLICESSGSTFLEISGKKVSNLTVVIPEMKEQVEIGRYFKNFDLQIEMLVSKIESLKQLKSASLVSMFPQAGKTKPRVRFKGFEEDWDRKFLSDCLETSTERNTGGKYDKNDVLSVSDESGVVNQIDLLGRSYAGKSVLNYGVLRKHQIVYTKSPLKQKPYGIIKQNTRITGIVSVLYAIYDTKQGIDPSYIHYYFDPAWRINNYMRPLVNKGAKNTMNISDETALTGHIMIPKTIEEQNKISSFFQNLDTQISVQEQRLEKLKQIKSACLNKMFV